MEQCTYMITRTLCILFSLSYTKVTVFIDESYYYFYMWRGGLWGFEETVEMRGCLPRVLLKDTNREIKDT